ncbi:partial putative murein peptide carboxypeptidase, partial [uncultured bacterium]
EQYFKSEAAGFELPSMIEIGAAYSGRVQENMTYCVSGSYTNNNLYVDEYHVGGEYGITLSGVSLFARGGYGVTRVLHRLPERLLAETAKLHCGFSDLTALSAFLRERCGLVSLHGPMVAADLAAPLDAWTAPFFPAMLEGRGPGRLEVPSAELVVPGRAEGPLVGGCLSLLAALCGTPWDYDYDEALLFLEEVGEEAYRVDRMLGTLVSSGRWGRLAGIIVGSMTRVTFGGSEDPDRLRQLLCDRLAPLGVPVALGLPFGHGGANVPLPVGARASWDGEARTLAVAAFRQTGARRLTAKAARDEEKRDPGGSASDWARWFSDPRNRIG